MGLKTLLGQRRNRILILLLMIILLGGISAYIQFFESSVITANYRFRLSFDEAVFNGRPRDSLESILFIGHAYGSPFDAQGVPSQTLVENIELLNTLNPDLIVLLGDLARTSDKSLWKELDDNFLSQLNSPIIIAAGNHDLEDRELFQDVYGQSYYYSSFGSNLIVILDSIIDECRIIGRQKSMLAEAVQFASDNPEIERVLIFTHRLIFLSPSHPLARYENRPCLTSNFPRLQKDFFSPLGRNKPVYIFSGDVGAFGGGENLSPFYYQVEGENIFAIAVGLGNGIHDKVILADLSQTNLAFQVVSLTTEEILPLEDYDPDYWMAKYELFGP